MTYPNTDIFDDIDGIDHHHAFKTLLDYVYWNGQNIFSFYKYFGKRNGQTLAYLVKLWLMAEKFGVPGSKML